MCQGHKKVILDTQRHTETLEAEPPSVTGNRRRRLWSRQALRNVPKAQNTFKILLIHGILQFTMLITLRCALHRCSSQDIHRWKFQEKAKQGHRGPKRIEANMLGKEAKAEGKKNQPKAQPPQRPTRFARKRGLTHKGAEWSLGTCANDPSAGSPTETLLRLLLPLSDKVH